VKNFNIVVNPDGMVLIRSYSNDIDLVTVVFKDNKDKVIYSTLSKFRKDLIVWYKIEHDINEISLEIYHKNLLIQKDKLEIVKQLSIFVDKELGVGDFMAVTPFIRKLYNIYNRKVDVYGYPQYENFLKNNPYVNNFYNRLLYNKEDINNKNDNFNVFEDVGVAYFYSDLRQLAAKDAKITLREEELGLDYFPDDYIDIKDLPNDYVCINPRLIYPDRTFRDKYDWQRLVDKINDKGIYVVAIGVGPSEHYDNLDIKLGVNLVYDERQNSMSQTWHIINKSKCFITFDTGIYILAGTTDTNILLNGWTTDPWFHMPFRKGSRYYKFYTIRGNCDIYCTSDPKTNVDVFGTIKLMHKSNECVLNKNHECIPTVDMIVDKLIKIIK